MSATLGEFGDLHCRRCRQARIFDSRLRDEVDHACKIADDPGDIDRSRRDSIAFIAEQRDNDSAALASFAQSANGVLNHGVRWLADIAEAECRRLRQVERKKS